MGLDMYLTNKNGEEIGYWRKANAVHGWFVKNVQDDIDECQETIVSLEKLQELYNVVVKVLENHDLAEELLPVHGGFFFGSYEYDEWYFQNIELTKNILEKAFQDKSDLITYQSSW